MPNRRLILSVLLVLTIVSVASAAEKHVVLFDAAKLTSVRKARTLWRPIHDDTPQVDVAKTGRERFLHLPGNFSTNTHWRVGWDMHGSWNLADCRKLIVTIRPDGSRGTPLTVYLQSGGGWYRGHLHVPAGTTTAELSPNRFAIEDTPVGWHTIKTVRVAIGRETARDRVVRVRKIHAVIGKSAVALYRNDAGAAKQRGISRYAGIVGSALDRIGIEYELMSDAAVAAGRLKGKRVAILPLNPVLPAAAARQIEKYVAAGGKLIVCYNLPRPLDKILGVRLAGHVDAKGTRMLRAIAFRDRKDRPAVTVVQNSWIARKIVPAEGTRVVGTWIDDTFVWGSGKFPADFAAVTRNRNGYFVGHVLTRDDAPGKERLLMAMLGELVPEVWRNVYDHRLARLGRAAGMKDEHELLVTVLATDARDAGHKKKLVALLDRARSLKKSARDALTKGDGPRACADLAKAHENYVLAFASSVSPRAGEFRAVWCHKPEGIPGRTWDEALKTLADGGFNAVFPNMAWGAGAAYKSSVLPMIDKGDQLALCVAAAKKYGIQVHVWKVNWAFWTPMPEHFRNKLRREGRLQQDVTGKTIRWLCPSDDENQKLERESMLDVVRNYDVDGIHFDYIRYPGASACFCPRCRRTFEKRFKVKVNRWPDDVRTGKLREPWLQFRRDNITRLVAAVSEGARKIKPTIKISAAVFPNWTSARDQQGQDWKLWVEKGYLDFVCPMMYTRDPAQFADRIRSAAVWIDGKVPLIPGIGAFRLSPNGTLEQILIARKHVTPGFILFDYRADLADEHLPLLKLGATSKKTKPMLK